MYQHIQNRISLLSIVCILCGVFFSPVVHAEPSYNLDAKDLHVSIPGREAIGNTLPTISDYTSVETPSVPSSDTSDGVAKPTTDTAKKAENPQKPTDTGASPKGDSSGDRVVSFVGSLILQIAMFFAWFGGMVLDISMNTLVFGMGELLKTSAVGVTIEMIWKVIRDISNLAFIFGFIYVGFMTMIDPHKAETKGFLTRIIIAALLINFSLFFVKFIIDAANLTAVEVYNSIAHGESLSAKFADQVGLSSLLNLPEEGAPMEKLVNRGMWFYIFASLMLMVMAFVMIVGGILLITRFVTLIFIMIASPLLFSATIFPKFSEESSNLWSKLLSNAFFAPVYIFLLLISLKLLETLVTVITGPGIKMSIVDALTSPSKTLVDSFNIILLFVIGIFFLIKSLTISQKMVSFGGSTAVKIAGATTFGLGALAMRNSLGWGATSLSKSKSFESLQARAAEGGMGGFMAQKVIDGTKKIGKSSYDARHGLNKISGAMHEGETFNKASTATFLHPKDRAKAYHLEQAEKFGYDHHKVEHLEKQFDKKDATFDETSVMWTLDGKISQIGGKTVVWNSDGSIANRSDFDFGDKQLAEYREKIGKQRQLDGTLDDWKENAKKIRDDIKTKRRQVENETDTQQKARYEQEYEILLKKAEKQKKILDAHNKDIDAVKNAEKLRDETIEKIKQKRGETYAKSLESSKWVPFSTDAATAIRKAKGKYGEAAKKLRPGKSSGGETKSGGGDSHGGGHH